MLSDNKDLTRFEGYVLDRSRWTIKCEDEAIGLSRKSFDLLLFLIDHRDRVLSKDELLLALWPDQFVEESNLTQQIFLLRKALSRHSSGAKIIETVPGRGYRFCALVEEEPLAHTHMLISMEEPAHLETERIETGYEGSPQTSTASAHVRSPRFFALVGLSALALLAIAFWFGWQRWLDRSRGAPVQIVLVPMEGTTGDAILDKSLTQALRMDLAQSPWVSVVPALTVTGRLAEMGHKADETMSAAVAREVCERTNSQAMLSGNIAKIGHHFLITEEAVNCVDGTLLGQAKYEAARAEDLPRAIDKIAAGLRQKMGESRRSIARFDVPLFEQNTSSLEALKAFTQGTQFVGEGKIPEAITLLKTAVADDPKFAAAYYSLASVYESVGDDFHLREAIAQAYAVKDTAAKSTQFAIATMYDSEYTGDMYELVQSFQGWVDLYPNSWQAWYGLTGAQRNLAMDKEALASSRRTVELLPHSQRILAALVLDQMRNGDFQGARATCERAVKDHLDGDGIRTRYLELAYLLHDRSLLEAQRAWDEAHPQAVMVLGDEAQLAMAEGRFTDARSIIARIRDLHHQQGLSGPDDERAKFAAVDLMQAGDLEAGKKIFQQSPVDIEEGQEVLGLVYAGDISGAANGLRASQVKYPKATMTKIFWGPRINAAIAMAHHKPAEAAAFLETARPLDTIGRFLPWHRGEAYLASGRPGLAEKDFRSVVDHPEYEPLSPYISLSWLGLGEALAAEGERAAAIDAYQHFLSLWAHADPDAMYLNKAKVEFATLQTAPPGK